MHCIGCFFKKGFRTEKECVIIQSADGEALSAFCCFIIAGKLLSGKKGNAFADD